jgi:transposase
MARYKQYCYDQGKLLSVHFHKQVVEGTFEHTLSYLIDNEVDLTPFDDRFCNDETGAPAYDPAILLKIILFAYSRGIISSRKIAQSCEENVIFMALSADSQPHFTTISDFIAQNSDEIVHLFIQVLMICDELDLIGRNMFAIDGCKMPSNASKDWSGTKAELRRKMHKMEKAIKKILKKHHQLDIGQADQQMLSDDKKYAKTLKRRIRKIKTYLSEHNDKPGKTGRPIKSNITDNDSAKMKTSHGVVQGYDGVAAVDNKHQIIVHAEAFGQAQEHDLLEPMIEGARNNMATIGDDKDVFEDTKVTADAGFHSETNMKMLAEQQIDAYVADTRFRQRDPRFNEVDKYKERSRKERSKKSGAARQFTTKDFKFADDLSYCICPAGKRLYRNGADTYSKGLHAVRFMGPKCACLPCKLRSKCLRYPDRTATRAVAYFTGKRRANQKTFTQQMKDKIDTDRGRAIYSKRIGTVEPVFAHMRHAMKMDRFNYRGKKKVDTQWKLFSIVHNLLKVHRLAFVLDTG